MLKSKIGKSLSLLLTGATFSCIPAVLGATEVAPAADKVKAIRFIEDDAQEELTSKIYEIKNQKANDLVPFILGAVKRYSSNGAVDRINYSAGNRQLVAVTCPRALLPYLDDLIAKLDRPGVKGKDNSGIVGTGITRTVFTPQYRSGKTMTALMTKSGISSNSSEGANQDAVVSFDEATNTIYWKDTGNKNADLQKYLAWLDRPIPQCRLVLNVYEIRESALSDVGIDYLAWRNGPGLDLFKAGATFLDGSALASTFGAYGFFSFIPSFDFSFVRMLEQNGKARLASSATLTVVNAHNASLSFTPQYSSMVKSDALVNTIAASDNDLFSLKITDPVVTLAGAPDRSGLLGYGAAQYDIGVVNFGYELSIKNVVERDNSGNELYEEATNSGKMSVQSGAERLLTRWTRTVESEVNTGVPFLSSLPVLKYFFGTATKSIERYYYFVSVRSEVANPDQEVAAISGKLIEVENLVNQTSEVK